MAKCDDCEYIKDEGPARFRHLETHEAKQEVKNDTTNNTLKEIKDLLAKFIEGVGNEVTELKTSKAVLEDRSDIQQKLNFKALAGIIFMVGVFLTVIVSIIF